MGTSGCDFKRRPRMPPPFVQKIILWRPPASGTASYRRPSPVRRQPARRGRRYDWLRRRPPLLAQQYSSRGLSFKPSGWSRIQLTDFSDASRCSDDREPTHHPARCRPLATGGPSALKYRRKIARSAQWRRYPQDSSTTQIWPFS